MKAIAALILAAASLAMPALQAQETASANAAANSASVAAASEAAASWLALMDAGNTDAAWDAAAPMLQKAVTRQTWAKVGGGVREPLGAVKTRKQGAAGYTRTLPNAPDGEYVVIHYTTDFAKRDGAVETVVPMRQPDGSWKVSGYFIR